MTSDVRSLTLNVRSRTLSSLENNLKMASKGRNMYSTSIAIKYTLINIFVFDKHTLSKLLMLFMTNTVRGICGGKKVSFVTNTSECTSMFSCQ